MNINIDGLNINYEIFGDGKPLLVLHGFMACIPAMSPIYNYFKNTRKVIVLDFPSQGGKSDNLKEAWGVEENAQMVHKFMKELNIEGADVIGHSFGGRIIIYLASKYTKLFDKIILVDAAGIRPKKNLIKFFRIYLYKLGRIILKVITPKEKYEEKLNKLRGKYSSTDYANLKSDVEREAFKKVINLDLTENLKYIDNSTLIMWGENDKDTPLYMAKIMAKSIRDSGLIILKGAGHFSYLDSSREFLKITQDFLGG